MRVKAVSADADGEKGPSGPVVGSGRFGTPWERMHRANFRSSVSCCRCWAWDGAWYGHRRWQARWAVWSRELLTPSCSMSSLGICPLLSGSGKFGMPWERMHREKATGIGEFADPPAFGEPPDPVDDGLALHAAASTAAAAMTVMTPAARARRGQGGRGPCPRPEELFISCLAAGLGDCGFIAASVPAGGGRRITRRK